MVYQISMNKKSAKVIDYRVRTKKRIVNAFGGSCGLCGYSKCYHALELHHIDPLQKIFSFGSIRANPKNWLEVFEELKKCILVCSNCHKEIHAGLITDISFCNRIDESYKNYKEFEK